MIRPTLLLLTLVPLATFALDVESNLEPVLDRKYECHDRNSSANKPTPYIFVEVFVAPEDMSALSDGVDPNEMTDDEALDLLIDALSASSELEFTTVTISDTEFRARSYQAGLDYRVDFGYAFEFEDYPDSVEYALIIQADGDAAFYDFSNVESGEETPPDRQLECKRTK